MIRRIQGSSAEVRDQDQVALRLPRPRFGTVHAAQRPGPGSPALGRAGPGAAAATQSTGRAHWHRDCWQRRSGYRYHACTSPKRREDEPAPVAGDAAAAPAIALAAAATNVGVSAAAAAVAAAAPATLYA